MIIGENLTQKGLIFNSRLVTFVQFIKSIVINKDLASWITIFKYISRAYIRFSGNM